ncbi:unnamed protein product, partial [Prorocentrum cordatum]
RRATPARARPAARPPRARPAASSRARGRSMGVGEDCATLACHGAAVSMVAASLLCVLDLAFSASLLQSTAESVLLLLGGFLCLQGETRLFHSHHEVIRENCGFALKPLGRGAAYLISGLYCVGARSAFLVDSPCACPFGGQGMAR